MSTTFSFIILYLIPVLTVLGTFGTYMLGYGTSGKELVSFVFLIVLAGFITSCCITVALISQFVKGDIIYSGIIFSLFGCLLGLAAFSFYILMFKQELRF